MTAEDALQLVLAQLDRHEVHYMVTGSFASNVHGVPRTTYDADIVIESSQKSLRNSNGPSRVILKSSFSMRAGAHVHS